MNLIQSFISLLGFRSMENPRRPLDPWGQTVGDVMEGSISSSGVRVSRDKALSVAAFWRGVLLISSTVGKLPFGAYRRTYPGMEPDVKHPAHWLLRKQPNEYMTAVSWKETMQGNALLHGNGYSYIVRNGDGTPAELLWLDPECVDPVRENGKLWYVYTRKGTGESRKLPAIDVFHLKGWGYDGLCGYPILQKGKEVLGHALASRTYGSVFFRNQARPSVLLKHPGKISPEARKNLRESWERLHQGLDNAHKTAVLEEGMDAFPLTISARDSQLIEVMSFSLIEIANLLGIPPHKLGASVNVSYKSLEQENQAFLDDSIDPWLVRWEEEAEAKLLTSYQQMRDTHAISFDRFPLVRADLQQRGEFYSKALNAGWISPDEVRAREGLNPMPGGTGKVYFRPVNLTAVGGDPDGPEGGAVGPADRLIDLPDIRQSQQWDCGAAAVLSVCQYFEVGVKTLSEAVTALGTTPQTGTTPSAILGYLSRSGLMTTAGSGLESADLATFFAAGQPVLCPVKTPQGGHWVAVIGTGLGYVFVQDPAMGRRMIPDAEWLEMWQDKDTAGNVYTAYGIAVGTDLLPEVEDEEEEEVEVEEETETTPADTSGATSGVAPDSTDDRSKGITGVLRGLIGDAMRRQLRYIRRSATDAAKHPAKFIDWLDRMPGQQITEARLALAAPVQALGLAEGLALSAEMVAEQFLSEVREGLLETSGRFSAALLADGVSRYMMEIETHPGKLRAYRIFAEVD